MMQQYKQVKAQYPGFLLFYRMGDFYELFGDDAKAAADILQITLTRRKTAKEGDEGVPMCGVPFHAAEGYIAKLINNGQKVALCEQVETPEQAKKRGGAKALVKRDVVRLYTPGTLTEDSMLNSAESNFLASVWANKGNVYLGWLELSTGEVILSQTTSDMLNNDMARIEAKEVLTNKDTLDVLASQLKLYESILTKESGCFNGHDDEGLILSVYGVKTLAQLGVDKKWVKSLASLIRYVELTQVGNLPQFKTPRLIKDKGVVQIDASTKQNLEVTQTLKGEKKGSLVHAIDRTRTPAGARMLKQWVTNPLTDVGAINKRLNALESLKNDILRGKVRDSLKQTADLSRALSRLTLGRGGPRDLGAIRQTLAHMPELQKGLNQLSDPYIQELSSDLTKAQDTQNLLKKAVKEDDDLPLLARDGKFVQKGYCAELDKYTELSSNAVHLLQKMEKRESERLKIPTLKIKYNKVWGYFIEVTKAQSDKVPTDYIHRQTTTNAMRFSTSSLMELEQELGAAQANMTKRELEIFDELVQAVRAASAQLLTIAENLATLDVLAAGAELAVTQNYVKPEVDDSLAFTITGGRHPVVEQMVDDFVRNDAKLDDGTLWLITGPNMAGKSTYLRQNALITILAQMGYFVPAESAHIGTVDKIFTRIGAADDLARGQSTFMVEMVETAAILNGASERSLVVLDEIGRGTATYDGLSIAWACMEHLLTVCKARGLFATHYHELTRLSETHTNLACYQMAVKEWQGEIVFLHKVKEGASPRSYGIHVGKLAGLPKSVIKRAESILNGLEKSAQGRKAGVANPADLPLFGVATNGQGNDAPQDTNRPNLLETRIMEASLDDLTPRQAHHLLYELKNLTQTK